jgi:hypothetical protein
MVIERAERALAPVGDKVPRGTSSEDGHIHSLVAISRSDLQVLVDVARVQLLLEPPT